MISLKDQFGYFNNQAFSEIKKSMDEKCSSYLSNFKVFTDFKKTQIIKVLYFIFYNKLLKMFERLMRS